MALPMALWSSFIIMLVLSEHLLPFRLISFCCITKIELKSDVEFERGLPQPNMTFYLIFNSFVKYINVVVLVAKLYVTMCQQRQSIC